MDGHKFKIEYIERIDRQNWGSSQCIVLRHIQRCLKQMRSAKSGRVESTIGKKTFLTIIVGYINHFMSDSLNLWERV